MSAPQATVSAREQIAGFMFGMNRSRSVLMAILPATHAALNAL
jgi:hypothetical protein